LRIFKQNFKDQIYVHIFATLQNFIQLPLSRTKLRKKMQKRSLSFGVITHQNGKNKKGDNTLQHIAEMSTAAKLLSPFPFYIFSKSD